MKRETLFPYALRQQLSLDHYSRVVSTSFGTERVCTTDRGPDITPRDYDRVFERFYQPFDSNSAQSGTGLGLPIAKPAAVATSSHAGSMPALLTQVIRRAYLER